MVALLFILGAPALWVALPQSTVGGFALIGAGLLNFCSSHAVANAEYAFGGASLDPALGIRLDIHWPVLIGRRSDFSGNASLNVRASRFGGRRNRNDDPGSRDRSYSGSHRSFTCSRCGDDRNSTY